MLGAIILGLVGLVFLILGYLIWKKEKISLLHDYHYNKVSSEDKKAFCEMSGKGVFVIGIGLESAAVIIGITDSPWSFIPFVVSFIIGLTMLIKAGSRYNR